MSANWRTVMWLSYTCNHFKLCKVHKLQWHLVYSRQMTSFLGRGALQIYRSGSCNAYKNAVFSKYMYKGKGLCIWISNSPVNRKCICNKSCATRHDCFKLAGVFFILINEGLIWVWTSFRKVHRILRNFNLAFKSLNKKCTSMNPNTPYFIVLS